MNIYRIFRIPASGIVLLSIVFGCSGPAVKGNTPASPAPNTVGVRGVVHIPAPDLPAPAVPCPEERGRKATAERFDKLDMLYTGKVAVDRDEGMLEVPDRMKPQLGKGFTVAAEPPVVEFAIIPVEPKFLTVYNNQNSSGWWRNYCQSDYDPGIGAGGVTCERQ